MLWGVTSPQLNYEDGMAIEERFMNLFRGYELAHGQYRVQTTEADVRSLAEH